MKLETKIDVDGSVISRFLLNGEVVSEMRWSKEEFLKFCKEKGI